VQEGALSAFSKEFLVQEDEVTDFDEEFIGQEDELLQISAKNSSSARDCSSLTDFSDFLGTKPSLEYHVQFCTACHNLLPVLLILKEIPSRLCTCQERNKETISMKPHSKLSPHNNLKGCKEGK
jgi:hypothetical protein